MSEKKDAVTTEELKNRLLLLKDVQSEAVRLERVSVLATLARTLIHTDAQRSLDAAQEAFDLANIHPIHDRKLAQSLYALGISNLHLTNYPIAFSQLQEALALYKKLNILVGEAKSTWAIGSTYQYLGAYPEAMEALAEAIIMYKKIGSKQGEAEALETIAIIQQSQQTHEEALEAFRTSFLLYEELGFKNNQAYILNNQAVSYLALNNFPKAIECSTRSLESAKKWGLKLLEAVVLCTLGEICLKTEDYDQAHSYFMTSIEKGKEISTQLPILHSHLNLGHLLEKKDESEKALFHLQEALKMACENDMKREEAKAYRYMSVVYKKQEKYKQALDEFEKFHLIENEIFNTEKDARIKNLYIIHKTETAKQESEIYRLKNELLEKEIAEQKTKEKRLQYAAMHDPLTGLPNRRLFFEQLDTALLNAKPNDHKLAVMFVDLDKFKPINDTYGHEVGDEVLIIFSKRLKNTVRENDVVARLAGDEFALFVDNISSIEQVKTIADKLTAHSEGVYRINGQSISLSFSIGISFYPADGQDAKTLLQHADQAMYQAKKNTKEHYRFFETK